MSANRAFDYEADLVASEIEDLPAAELVRVWQAATESQQVFSPAAVQRMLLVLYAELADQPIAGVIGPWIALTLERQLFGAEELAELLGELGKALASGAVAADTT